MIDPEDWLLKRIPDNRHSDFKHGAYFSVTGRELFDTMVNKFQSNGFGGSSHSNVRIEHRVEAANGEILYGLTINGDTFFQYERFPAYCIPCHLITWIEYKIGNVNIGPDSTSRHTEKNPIYLAKPM
jgi:hypothetical protein